VAKEDVENRSLRLDRAPLGIPAPCPRIRGELGSVPIAQGCPCARAARSEKVLARQMLSPSPELLCSHLVLGFLFQPPLLVQGFGGDAAGGALLLFLRLHGHVLGLVVLLAALHVGLLGLAQVHLCLLLPGKAVTGVRTGPIASPAGSPGPPSWPPCPVSPASPSTAEDKAPNAAGGGQGARHPQRGTSPGGTQTGLGRANPAGAAGLLLTSFLCARCHCSLISFRRFSCSRRLTVSGCVGRGGTAPTAV